jgi:hypothetical protein
MSRLAMAAVVALTASLAACDATWFGATPGATCTGAGLQCQLPEGPLGVCERASCAAGATPPCFTCTPQH